MRLEVHQAESLPRLAWHARVAREGVQVMAGAWVTAADDWFAEGAWNGGLGEGALDRATYLVGSGAVVRRGQVVFCTPTHAFEHLYSTRAGDELLISNSLVFLMREAGIELDTAYPNYIFDIIQARRTGIRPRPFPLRGGIDIHTGVNLIVNSRGELEYRPKPLPPRPVDFGALLGIFDSTLSAVFENAADPARPQPFRPVVPLSRGYDSTAVAALARRHGCREAVTSVDPRTPEDCGTPVGEALGMPVTEYPRSLPPDLDVRVVGEFLASAMGVDLPKAVMAEQLEGAVLLIGNDGDQLFGTRPGMLSRYGNPTALTGPGASYLEFRLRLGMLNFPVPAIVGRHPDAVQAITHSAEMQPWATGTGYDRPIARRIGEEAGVPGHLFGQAKAATSHVFVHTDGMPAQASASFEAWLSRLGELPDTGGLRSSVTRWVQKRWVAWMMNGYKTLPLGVREMLRPIVLRPWWAHAHRMWGSRYLYGFHWGVDQIKDRYEVG